MTLPPLPLAGWEATKDTLHLWAQIVGKVRMAASPPRNHWWHASLFVDVRGHKEIRGRDGDPLCERTGLSSRDFQAAFGV